LNLDLLIWSIPGLVVLAILAEARSNYPLAQKSTWEYVVELVPLSLTCFVFSFLIQKSLFVFFPEKYIFFSGHWNTLFPFKNSFRLVLAIILAFPVAVFIPLVYRFYHWFGTKFTSSQNRGDVLPSNSQVYVTLKNGKVYVGRVQGATADHGLGNRYLKLYPLMSGYRTKQHRVVYTTIYGEKRTLPSLVRMNVSEIVTIGKFEWDIFDSFLNEGTAKISFGPVTKRRISKGVKRPKAQK